MAYTGSTPLTPLQNLFNTLETNLTAAIAVVSGNLTTTNNTRQHYSYRWANAAARTAQGGMREDDTGYQIDTDTVYRYTGGTWRVWEKPWASYTPTLTNFTGSVAPTTTGRWGVQGGVMEVIVTSKLAATGTYTVGLISVSTPVAIDTTGMILGSTLLNGTASFNDFSADFFPGFVRVQDANTVRPLRPLQPASYASARLGAYDTTTSGTPMTWGANDELSLAFRAPVA